MYKSLAYVAGSRDNAWVLHVATKASFLFHYILNTQINKIIIYNKKTPFLGDFKKYKNLFIKIVKITKIIKIIKTEVIVENLKIKKN